jgi:ribosomal protein S18 acetylase RimI-like enzyme
VNFEIRRGGVDDVERLEPLWEAMREHHAGLPAMEPVRSADDSWERRGGQYREWIGDDDHALLIAEREGDPIGYAIVSIGDGPATWDVGDRVAEIESLSVLASARGGGVGRALTEAAFQFAAEAGAGATFVGIAHSNEGALRFYAREGFEPFYVTWVKR